MAFKLVNQSTPRDRTDVAIDLELRASGRLVGIIDVLLGLTLVEGALSFRSMFSQGSTANTPAILAMVLVYYTAVRSFVDWHIAMEVRPYRILTDKRRTLELGRVFLDFLIMASYSFLLLRAHILIDKPGSDITAIAIAYTAIYCAYFAWGELRQRTTPVPPMENAQPYRRELLIFVTMIAGLLLAGYIIGRGHRWLCLSKADFNTVFLSLELAAMVWYRHKNWSQQVILNEA